MRLLDLFSGIGGFSLAASWVWGDELEIVSFVEIDPFCRKVLKKHWPNVPIEGDIKNVDGKKWKGTVDLITGGFPCQDISVCGPNSGIDGKRTGLYRQLLRIVCEVRPRFILMENVSALLQRGIGNILGELAKSGYDAEWDCVRACELGSPHKRERLWVIAYPNSLYGEKRMGIEQIRKRQIFKRSNYQCFPIWLQTPDRFIGMDDGIPSKSYQNRGRSLGNAIVPQVAMVIMRAIKEVES